MQYDPETQTLTTPEGFKELYRKYVESGMAGITQPPKYGGGGAPHPVAIAISEMATACNKSFSMCPGLGHGLVESLLHWHGRAKANVSTKLISGEWSGTMYDRTPMRHDLGLMTTGNSDGDAYKITGTKIWITFGEHDLTENIVHLVLARHGCSGKHKG